jgi:sec-independent protein translocase protein TatB
MFDLAWSEIALIAVVALVVIGPKDLPEAVRGVARGIQKLRRMANEFRSQADELVREANLDELRQQIHDIKNFNVRDEFEKAVDKDGALRRSFDDPLRDTYTPPAPPPSAGAAAGGAEPFGPPAPDAVPEVPADAAPAFIPPPDVDAVAAEPHRIPAAAAAAAEPRIEPALPTDMPPAGAASAPAPVVHRT